MGVGNSNESKQKVSFSCTYLVKDYDDVQIINNKYEEFVNNEIEKKIKILNGGKEEKVVFKKKFNKIGLNQIDFIIKGKLKDTTCMFNDCSSLKNIEFFSFDTSHVTLMNAMFQNCKELEYLDLSNFNSSKVTSLGLMFNGCNKLKEIKGINNFDTKNVENLALLFSECQELEYLDLSNFNTNKVTDMMGMFNKCNKLKVLIILIQQK